VIVGNDLVEGQFNDWLLHAVVIFDELATSDRDAVRLKNKLKGLINGRQSINAKYRDVVNTEINSYLAITSNDQVTSVPVAIEPGDRRYSVSLPASGGTGILSMIPPAPSPRQKISGSEATARAPTLWAPSCPIQRAWTALA